MKQMKEDNLKAMLARGFTKKKNVKIQDLIGSEDGEEEEKMDVSKMIAEE